MNKKIIYIADDEESIRVLLKQYLEKEGYEIHAFIDGETILKAFQEKECHMMIIDIRMPNMDGYSLCREIRAISNIPIIIVSAKDDEIDRILGLELGGDDYLNKPFSLRELAIRIKKIFSRTQGLKEIGNADNILQCKDLILLRESRCILKEGAEVAVTTKEFELLALFMENKNKALTRNQIIEMIWGYEYIGDTRQVDDLIRRVRKKFMDEGILCEIQTIWGYGYKMSE
ncbi:MAG: response regulator transcription factor [Cellulosilyticaceae bacterium]